MPRPVVVGGRKGFCSRAIPSPGPSQNPALCGSPPAKCSSASASFWCEGGTPLGALVLVRVTCRLRHSRFGQRSCPRPLRSRGQLPCRRSRAGSFRQQKPAVPRAGQLAFAVSTPRYGFAVLYLAAIPPHPAPVGARADVEASCFYSWGGASSRGRRCPAWALVRAHSFGPFRPRPRRPSAFPQRRSLPLLQGA